MSMSTQPSINTSKTDTLSVKNISPNTSPSLSPQHSPEGLPNTHKKRKSILSRITKTFSLGGSPKETDHHDTAGEIRHSPHPIPNRRRQRTLSLVSWINSYLNPTNSPDIDINALSTSLTASTLSDLSDGQILLALIHKLFPQLAKPSTSPMASSSNDDIDQAAIPPSPESHNHAMSYPDRKKSIEEILKFTEKKLRLNISTLDIEEILNGNKDVIAILVQEILVAHCNALLNTMGYKGTEMEALLAFVNSCIEPRIQRKLESPFAKSFGDGLILCALMDKLCPGSLDLSALRGTHAKGNHIAVLATGTRSVSRQLKIIPPFLLTQFNTTTSTDGASAISSPIPPVNVDSDMSDIGPQTHRVISPISTPIVDVPMEERVEDEDIILYICMIISSALGSLSTAWTNPTSKSVVSEKEQDYASPIHESNKGSTTSHSRGQSISSVQEAIEEAKPDVTDDMVAQSRAEINRINSLQKSIQSLEQSVKEFEKPKPKIATPVATHALSSKTHTDIDHDEMDSGLHVLESLRAALVESQKAREKSVELLKTFGNSLATEMAIDEAANVHRKVSIPMSAVSSTSVTSEQSVRNMLVELPAKDGWLMEETFIVNGQNFARRYAKLQFDSLYLGDDESVPIVSFQRYNLADYQLIHLVHPIYKHAAADGRSANENNSSSDLQSPPAPYEKGSSYPHSVLIREKGAYVLHLLPKSGCSAQILHLSGADEHSVSDAAELKEWAEAINARIELLHLLKAPTLSTLMMNGGRAMLSFLCSVDSRHLRIENEAISLLPTLQYFKEHLILRAPYALTLRNVCLVDSDLRVISEICMMNHGITSLDLSYNALTDAGFAYILSIVEVSKGLITLRLDGNQLTGEGLDEIANLLSLRRLKSLSLQTNAITSNACIAFFDKLYASIPTTSPSLEMIELNLSDNPIDDEISNSLCILLKRCTIQRLRLSHTNITDHTVEALAATLLSFPNDIELLDFSYNKLTYASLAALSPALLACPSAVHVDLSGIHFSFEKLNMLSASGVSLETSRLIVKKRPVNELLAITSTDEVILDDSNKLRTPSNGNEVTLQPQNIERRMSFVREDAETGEVEILDPSFKAEQQASLEHLPISEPVLSSVATITASSPPSALRRGSLSITKSPDELQHADTLAAPAPVGTSVENLEDGNTIRPTDREVRYIERRRNSLSQ